MNILLCLFISYLIFLENIEGGENSSEENNTKEQCDYEFREKSHLVLIREDSNLQLAEPVETRHSRFGTQVCYSTVAVAEFENFCPPNEEEVKQCADHSLCSDEENILFPTTLDLCQSELQPTIKPIINEKPCFYGETQTGTEYQVGYTVWNEKTKNANHVLIYKICHSPEEGTLYTFHIIRSLHLLYANGYSEIGNERILESKLGVNKPIKTILMGKKNYQFVNFDDMPIHNWETPTFFDFNITSVKGEKVLAQLQTVDNIIRMSVIHIYKPVNDVNVYTGKFQTTKLQLEQMKAKIEESTSIQDNHDLNNSKTASHISMKLLRTEHTFIWKILQHDTEGAIAIITQINPFNQCFQICPNIASDENWPEFKDPKKKKCTYACQVTKIINKLFGLPDLGEISKILRSRFVVDKYSKSDIYANESEGYTNTYGEQSYSNWFTGLMLTSGAGGNSGGGDAGGGGDAAGGAD